MKIIIAFLSLVTLLFMGCKPSEPKHSEPQVEVPAAVQSQFNSMYPDVKDVKWEKEDTRYGADFDLNGVQTEVQFFEDGNLFMTESEIPVTELPLKVTEYFDQNLPGKKISEASKLVTVEGIVSFEAEVENVDYLFDSGGIFAGKEEEKEEKGEKDEKH